MMVRLTAFYWQNIVEETFKTCAMDKFKKWFSGLFKKQKCNHGFEIKEVADLRIDPCCKKCGKKISELT